ncbi:MAG: hypothetical protein B6242_13445 [Anaerolineaceae bacterium 4572_78]|nr:MAG: hypothetical protein B6242_13445 [Anaerolineaceae bacterium 4572_78]
MKIIIHTDSQVFDDLKVEWYDLMERATVSPIFSTPDYQQIWWQYLGHGELRILTIYEESTDILVGIAPLFIDDGKLTFIGCVDVSDYLDFLVDKNYTDQVYEIIINYLKHEPEWQSVYFCSLPYHSPALTSMLSLAEKANLRPTSAVEEICPIITLPDTWQSYLSSVNRKQRQEIQRKLRRVEVMDDSRLYVIDNLSDLSDELIDAFVILHKKSNHDKESFWDESLENFFRTLIKRMAELGWLKFYFIDIDDNPAAALLCFDYQNEILVYNSGFDYARHGYLGVGNAIVSYSIRHAIELKRNRYDFLRGDEKYKFKFGAIGEDVYDIKINRLKSHD